MTLNKTHFAVRYNLADTRAITFTMSADQIVKIWLTNEPPYPHSLRGPHSCPA
jgi:hypothetical protein